VKAYEYIIKIRDKASTSLRSIARRAGTTQNKLRGMVARMRSASIEGSKMGDVFSKLGKVLATVFIVGSLSSFLSNVISIRAEFEKYEAVLTNTFQSAEAGQTAMNMIKDFAAKTPFQLNQLTGAYVKLVNRGFVPTKKNMTSLGDLAASQGKSFDQLTEAILDAETAEFERLKEFGIKASKAGNKVTFAFKGVKKNVDANAKSIRKAILGFGDMKGVTRSMAAISKTLGGRLSNLKDKWNNLLNSIGKNGGGVFGSVIEALGKGIDFLQRNLQNITVWFGHVWGAITRMFDPLQRLIQDAFGFKNSADAVTNSLSWLNTAFSGIAWVIDLVSTGVSTIINWFLGLPKPIKNIVYGLIAFKAAIWLVNLAMYANPVGLVIAGIMLLIGVIGFASKYITGWGQLFDNMGEKLKGFGKAITYYIVDRMKELLKGVIGIGKALMHFFREEWSEAWETGKNAVQDLSGVKSSNKLIKETFKISGLKFDAKQLKKDFTSLKDKFSNATGKKGVTGDYGKDVVGKFGNSTVNPSGDGKETSTSGIAGITGGGKKQTHITINLDKLQDTTEIHTVSLDEGIEESEDRLIEMFLRVLNSANQIQTG
jgi:hypothetical protein